MFTQSYFSGRPFVKLLLIWCLFCNLGIQAREILGGLDRKKVEIINEATFLNEVPQRGVVVINFRVVNHMNKPGRWEFDFYGAEGWRKNKVMESRRWVEVDAKSAKTVSWEIPVLPNTEFSDASTLDLEVGVTGPGASSQREDLIYSRTHHFGAHDAHAMVALSPELAITRDHWNYNDLENKIENAHYDLTLSRFDPEAMPSQVTGFSGIDILMMTSEEWQSFAVHQAVILKWVAGGGQLVLVSNTPKRERQLGAGTVTEIGYRGVESTIAHLRKLPSIEDSLSLSRNFDRKNWELLDEIPKISQSFGGIMLFVILIAALLGPVNLWFSFRKKNLLQVIWTTPLISLVLSLLVGAVIVFADGFGGKGQRAAIVLLVPELDLEVLIQEQVSRTGVLIKDRFSLPEGTELYMSPSERDRSKRKLVYHQLPDGEWSGSWFENRSIQAQVLRRTRSNRSDVVLKQQKGTHTVLSTVDAHFDRMFIYEGPHRWLMAESVSPGTEKRMIQVDRKTVYAFFEEIGTRKKLMFPDEKTVLQPGWFYAESKQDERYIDTLSSIRWEDRPVWYMGQVKKEGIR